MADKESGANVNMLGDLLDVKICFFITERQKIKTAGLCVDVLFSLMVLLKRFIVSDLLEGD